MKVILGFFVLGLFLSGCSATGGSASAPAEKAAESGDAVAEASDDGVYCRREHVLRGSRLKTQVCTTTAQRTEEKRAQDRMREGVRRMQDQGSGQNSIGAHN